MNKTATKTLMNRLTPLAAFIALFAGAAQTSHATSCQSVLQEHIDWKSQAPAGSDRKIDLVVTSTASVFIDTKPEVGYLETQLNHGVLYGIGGQAPTPDGTLFGAGQALLNTNRWTGNCNYLNCPPDSPFDPNNTETWNLTLKAADNVLEITKGSNAAVSIPLDCSGSSIVALQSAYVSEDGHYVHYGNTRYELFLIRNETTATSPWGFR